MLGIRPTRSGLVSNVLRQLRANGLREARLYRLWNLVDRWVTLDRLHVDSDGELSAVRSAAADQAGESRAAIVENDGLSDWNRARRTKRNPPRRGVDRVDAGLLRLVLVVAPTQRNRAMSG
jgi:hypothetical protein